MNFFATFALNIQSFAMKFLKSLRNNPNLIVLILLGTWFLLNLLQAIFTELSNDEAYYWFVCRPLAWGFFDHPPMISLLTWLGVNILGDTEIGIRFFSLILQPLYLYLFWTLVRPAGGASWRMALTYCVVAFAVPLLQLYGFVATPDSALMMSVALTLWSYDRFTKSPASWQSTLLLGLSFALMAYSKYHGALVVVLIVLSNLKLLAQWRFWVSGVVALVLITPHFLWQIDHNWITFNYHLVSRNSDFQWGNVLEYLLNVLATFGPFMLPVFAYILYKYRRGIPQRPPLERALIWIAWGFFIFFLFSTKRGHVQPQWLIPAVFSMLYFLVRYCGQNPRTRRYVMLTSWIMGGLFLAARVFIMSYHGDAINFEIFNNKATYAAIDSATMGRPIILSGKYAIGAKINYYAHDTTKCFARPSLHGRDNQWSLLDIDTKFYGQKVVQELSGHFRAQQLQLPKDKRQYPHFMHGTTPIFFDTVDYYIPIHRVHIQAASMPKKLLIKQLLAIDLIIDNPYDFDIPLAGTQAFKIVIQFKQGRFFHKEVDLPISHTFIAANGLTRVTTTVEVPELETGEYLVGFSIIRDPFDSWINSDRVEMQIVNPKTRV